VNPGASIVNSSPPNIQLATSDGNKIGLATPNGFSSSSALANDMVIRCWCNMFLFIWVLMGWYMPDILRYVQEISFALVQKISKTSFFYLKLHLLISFQYLESRYLWIDRNISQLDIH
jgi:hypothetical protein